MIRVIVPTHFSGGGTIYSNGFFFSIFGSTYSSQRVVSGFIRNPVQCRKYN